MNSKTIQILLIKPKAVSGIKKIGTSNFIDRKYYLQKGRIAKTALFIMAVCSLIIVSGIVLGVLVKI